MLFAKTCYVDENIICSGAIAAAAAALFAAIQASAGGKRRRRREVFKDFHSILNLVAAEDAIPQFLQFFDTGRTFQFWPFFIVFFVGNGAGDYGCLSSGCVVC